MSPPAGVVDGLLADRYRLVARLGTGGNGEVWHARDERLDRDVAVKVLPPELADDDDVRARFRAEARHAGGLRHPGIAAVFDFAEDDAGAWLVMELVDGAPLSEVLRREGRLPADRVLDVVGQAAGALQAAHDGGVVHRDVKPGNLLLRPDGRLSVTDFGIAHATGAATLTRTGQVVGTAAYLSPEQASGQPVRPATDLYALGVVAYECLSGVRPFERDDPVAVLLAHLQAPPPPLPPDVPEPVADLVHRLLAKDPADRPTSAAAVQREAAALRSQLATAVPPTAVLPTAPVDPVAPVAPVAPAAGRSPLGLAERPGQRRAVRATAVALGLLALALGIRDATTDDPPSPVTPRPASTAPATSAPESSAPESTAPTDEPVAEQQEQQAPPAQEEPVQEPVQQPQGGQDEPVAEQPDEQQDEQQRKEQEKQQEQDRKELEKQQEQQRKEQERGDQGRGGDG